MDSTTNNGGLLLAGKETAVTVEQITAFVSFVHAGLDAWLKAGQLLAQMVDADHLAFKKIMRECPSISMDVLLAFERIGRKLIYPKLLLDPSPGSKRLLTFPYEMQERFCAEKVKVLLRWHPTQPQFIEKSVQALSHSEAEQVLGEGKVRTLEEQSTLLHAKIKTNTGAKSKNRMAAGNNLKAGRLTSAGYYKILWREGRPELVKIDGVYPYALPIELTSMNDSEPFEIIHLVK